MSLMIVNGTMVSTSRASSDSNESRLARLAFPPRMRPGVLVNWAIGEISVER